MCSISSSFFGRLFIDIWVSPGSQSVEALFSICWNPSWSTSGRGWRSIGLPLLDRRSYSLLESPARRPRSFEKQEEIISKRFERGIRRSQSTLVIPKKQSISHLLKVFPLKNRKVGERIVFHALIRNYPVVWKRSPKSDWSNESPSLENPRVTLHWRTSFLAPDLSWFVRLYNIRDQEGKREECIQSPKPYLSFKGRSGQTSFAA